MHKLPGYKFLDIVSRGESSNLYRALRLEDHRHFLVKIPNGKSVGISHADLFKWESQVLASLDLPGVIDGGELVFSNGEPFLIMNDFEGVSWELLERSGHDVLEFLFVAVRVAEVLGDVHQKGIVIKSVNPSNILVSPRNGEVRLVGFGYSTRLAREFSDFLELKNQVDDFAYMAPEQTGRMNCDVDYRVDWYSLGATFYKVLSGHKPFPGSDVMDMVYAHIARYPRNLHYLNPKIPEMVSSIITKLMAKQPEERYQSKHGLIADLKNCLTQIRERGSISRFDLGTKDISVMFNIPRKLYGRREEVATIMRQFDSVSQGNKSLTLISGHAGVGKSSIVWEVHRPIVGKHGFFLSGKFDQYNRRMPYSALFQALRGMVRQILAAGKDQVDTWRNAILTVVGANGKLLVDVIPELVRLIGKRPDVPLLPPAESQNRFMAVLGSFIRLFAKKEHPLLLFLDDVQWADSPSLKMLENFLLDPECQYLMVVCSFRGNEVDEGHPLTLAIDNFRRQQVPIEELRVLPLDRTVVAELVADILACDWSDVGDLARVCHQKTDGNPFFLRQFLMAIYKQKLIYFDSEAGRWQWSIREITSAQITENVADLMANQILNMHHKTRTLLKMAACIGTQFDLGSLALVSDMPFLEARDFLWPALEGGLIRPRNERYKFVSTEKEASSVYFYFLHDRIQQAAYAQISKERLERTHLDIGRILLDRLDREELNRRLFEVVNHLQQGLALITAAKERFTLANLLLRAGIRAKESSVFKLAAEYLESALALMKPEHWNKHYPFMRDLHLEAAETCYFHQRLEDMETLLEEVLARSKHPVERRRVYEIRVQGYVAAYEWVKAYQVGVEGLADLGLKFPKNASDDQVREYLLEASMAIDRVGLDAIPNLPMMTDDLELNQVRLLATVITPAFLIDFKLFSMMTARFVSLSMVCGHMELSSYLYSSYCIVIANEDVGRAFSLGNTAIQLARRFSYNKAHGRTVFTVHGNISFRKRPLRELVDLFLDPYAMLIESGDVEFASYCLLYHLMFSTLAGNRTLPDLETVFERWSKVLKRLGVGFPVASFYHQAILNLGGKSDFPETLTGQVFDRQEMENLFREKQDTYSLCYLYTLELMLNYLFGKLENAALTAEKIRAFVPGTAHEYNTSIYYTFASLALLAQAEVEDNVTRARLLAEVTHNQKILGEWAKEAPTNFLARWRLVEGEMARVEGRTDDVMIHFDSAIAMVAKGDNLWERALAYELFGRYWLSQNTRYLAGIFLRRAASSYLDWGAFGKVKQMKQEYGALLDQANDEGKSLENQTWNEYDLSSIIKATQVISSEIVLSDVLKKLVMIAMENAGAQRGFLLYEHDGQWLVAAQGDPDEARVFFKDVMPLDTTALVSRGICRYVINTGESVVLQDASESEVWDNDSYVRKHRPKSLFCMPIHHKNHTVAVLYLENNLRRAVFTDNHRRVLGMLATQAAISLENAALYGEQEHKVEERTRQLRYKTEQIMSSIRYAKRIQDGILQNPKSLHSQFVDLFVSYQPKDIVSGDLYWFREKGQHLLVAAIDCTGHGVPGALMSMIGQILLTQVVNEMELCDPAAILEELSNRVRKVLAIEAPRSTDGMEVCCCSIDQSTFQLTFAGASRPLYLVRKGYLMEIKGTHRSLGDLARSERHKFNNQVIGLEAGDNLYLTTDGYADQFDETPKRFGKGRLKRLLEQIASYSPLDQKKALEQNILTFRGSMPQRDDITVVGLKVREPNKSAGV